MQIASLAPAGPQVGNHAPHTASATEPISRPARAPTDAQTRRPGGESPLPRGSLRSLDPALNGTVSAAQQALAFLNEGASRLQQLKSGLSERLASGAPPAADAALGQQITSFDRFWRSRRNATAGSLDGQLNYNSAGQAHQRFAIQGLTRQALRAGDEEVLFVMAGAQRFTSVHIDPSLGEDAQLRRFDLALGTIGIQVAKGPGELLAFSTEEAIWPEIRDGLMIRGGGRRFPTGQFNRVHAEAAADVVSPRSWSLADTDAARDTLQRVVAALDRFAHARDTAAHALFEAASRVQQAAAGSSLEAEAAWAESFAAQFDSMVAARSGYARFATLAPAVAFVSRERIQALLAQR